MQLLLDAGANVHSRSKDGRTLLHHAALIGSYDDLLRLLDLGVDLRAVNEGGDMFQCYFFMETCSDAVFFCLYFLITLVNREVAWCCKQVVPPRFTFVPD